MIYEISNEFLVAKINSKGAELISVKSKKNNIEFIWQGSKKYWKGHSPVLFPFCGRLYKKRYTFEGKTYKMPLHGFAHSMDFSCKVKNSDELQLILVSNKKTLRKYPFNFSLIVGFKIINNSINFTFRVINNDDKEMYFSIGGHPGFCCPINNVGKFEDYYVELTNNQYKHRIFTDRILNSGKTEDYPLESNRLRLKHNLFDNDAIFIETQNRREVLILKSDLNENSVKLSFDNMSCVGFWHSNKTNAPFICFEPSAGFPGHDLIIEDLKTMLDVNKLEKGSDYFNHYTVEFNS